MKKNKPIVTILSEEAKAFFKECGREGAEKRWANTTIDEKEKHMDKLHANRWANTTPEMRQESLKKVRASQLKTKK